MPAVITIAFGDLINIYKIENKFGVPLVAPNFDRLADMGVGFEAAFAPVAVCHPACTAALSGQSQFGTDLHPSNKRLWNDIMSPDDTVIAMFNEAGWTTHGSGKVSHSSAFAQIVETFADLYDCHFQSDPTTTPSLTTTPWPSRWSRMRLCGTTQLALWD